MKKILICLTLSLIVFFMFACSEISTTTEGEGTENIPADDANDQADVEQVPVVNDSKFVEYLKSVITDAPASQVIYLLESTTTHNGVTTSEATAVVEGKIFNIVSVGETITANIYTPDMHATLDCVAKTYVQSPMDPAVYEQALASVECVPKYNNIEFTPSGYTVVDKDCYAEVAVIDGVTKIFVFDDGGAVKYIIYASEDGSLVTEEIISLTADASLISPDNFTVPENYTPATPVQPEEATEQAE